jgi:hypothetical protein
MALWSAIDGIDGVLDNLTTMAVACSNRFVARTIASSRCRISASNFCCSVTILGFLE